MKRDSQQVINDLIDSAIKVIARDGFDKATTRNIASECGLADAYIYQYFKDKDELIVKAFDKMDNHLSLSIREIISNLFDSALNNEQRCCIIFSHCWKLFGETPDACRFYLQYLYSPYFYKYSRERHSEIWQKYVEDMSQLFSIQDNARTIIIFALNATLTLALKSIEEGKMNDEETERASFNAIYGVVKPYLKD